MEHQTTIQNQNEGLSKERQALKLLYTVAETCQILGIERKTLYRLKNSGELTPHPAFRGKLLFHIKEIERFAGLQPLSAERRAA